MLSHLYHLSFIGPLSENIEKITKYLPSELFALLFYIVVSDRQSIQLPYITHLNKFSIFSKYLKDIISLMC